MTANPNITHQLVRLVAAVNKGVFDDRPESILAQLRPYVDVAADVAKAVIRLQKCIEDYEAKLIARDIKQRKRDEIKRHRAKLMVVLIARDGYYCAKCRSADALVIDHIKPLALGGNNDLENLQLLCKPCNWNKGATEADYRSGGAK